MGRNYRFDADATISDPRGAPPKGPIEFKPLNVQKYLLSPRRRTKVEEAPSRIAGKLYELGESAW